MVRAARRRRAARATLHIRPHVGVVLDGYLLVVGRKVTRVRILSCSAVRTVPMREAQKLLRLTITAVPNHLVDGLGHDQQAYGRYAPRINCSAANRLDT